jgi:hypothetical protein
MAPWEQPRRPLPCGMTVLNYLIIAQFSDTLGKV